MPQTGAVRDPQIEELLAMERRYDAALLAGDVAALQGILAERFFLNDFMGGVVARSELLKYLSEGKLKFHLLEAHEWSAQHYGDMGLVTGWTDMKAELEGDGNEVKSRFLHVYVKEAGAWRLVAAQGTVIPELD